MLHLRDAQGTLHGAVTEVGKQNEVASLTAWPGLHRFATCRAGLLAVTLYCDSSCSVAAVAAARRQLEAHLQGQQQVRKTCCVRRGCSVLAIVLRGGFTLTAV